MKKVLLLLLFLLVALESPTGAFASQIEMTTPTPVVKVGDLFTVTVRLSGGENTMGTDVVLVYSPQIVQAVKVTAGKLYPVYNPPEAKRIYSTEGKVLLSGSANIGRPVVANGVFVTVIFKALGPIPTTITIDYQKGGTSKSGIIDFSGRDLISISPQPLQITITELSVVEKLVQFITNLFKNISPS